MYARYLRNTESDRNSYQFVEKCSLFGCNAGFIPWLLRHQIPPSQGEPYKWHLPIRKCLDNAEYKGTDYKDSALVIDLKPKQNKTNISFYEVLDVWGYSDSGWTPILLHLNGLFIDESPDKIDRNNFSIPRNEEREGEIYEFMYLNGSIDNGKLVGKWTAPPTSPTNAALLFHESLQYFIESIQARTPWLFS